LETPSTPLFLLSQLRCVVAQIQIRGHAMKIIGVRQPWASFIPSDVVNRLRRRRTARQVRLISVGLQLKRPQNIALCGRRAPKSIVYELTPPRWQKHNSGSARPPNQKEGSLQGTGEAVAKRTHDWRPRIKLMRSQDECANCESVPSLGRGGELSSNASATRIRLNYRR
jgi:hypothetical protein